MAENGGPEEVRTPRSSLHMRPGRSGGAILLMDTYEEAKTKFHEALEGDFDTLEFTMLPGDNHAQHRMTIRTEEVNLVCEITPEYWREYQEDEMRAEEGKADFDQMMQNLREATEEDD